MGQVGRWIVDELIIYDMTREKYVKFYFNQIMTLVKLLFFMIMASVNPWFG